MVGGKGGVGKTTCAAALAVASAAAGQRTLVISTDPAPSLGDALRRPLAAAPRRIPLRRGLLDAVEIDASRALERWLSKRCEAFERIARDIRSAYTLAYTPTKSTTAAEHRRRKVSVYVRSQDGRALSVRTRDGYFEKTNEERQ